MLRQDLSLFDDRRLGKRLAARRLLRAGVRPSAVAQQIRASSAYVRKVAQEMADEKRALAAMLREAQSS